MGPVLVVSFKLVSLVRKVSKVSLESADGRGEGRGSYMGAFLPNPGKIFQYQHYVKEDSLKLR